jgi:hypothetical protein
LLLLGTSWVGFDASPATRGAKPLVAEAYGNRPRLRALARTPALKFGDRRVAGCDLVLPGAIQSRSAGFFVPSGAVLCCRAMSWMFATGSKQGRPCAPIRGLTGSTRLVMEPNLNRLDDAVKGSRRSLSERVRCLRNPSSGRACHPGKSANAGPCPASLVCDRNLDIRSMHRSRNYVATRRRNPRTGVAFPLSLSSIRSACGYRSRTV